ncbi:MAG: OmpH family outer membrane protein [Cryomorphaceae bacterium]|nr:OmpH family outer membrane protein [Cryomorphaceae bacterium]
MEKEKRQKKLREEQSQATAVEREVPNLIECKRNNEIYKMKMRKLLILLLMIGAVSPLLAQKFGHIDSQALLLSMPERETAQKQIEEQAAQFETEMTRMQTDMQTKYDDYLAKAESWPEAIRKTKEKELNQMQQGLQDFSQTAQSAIAQLEEELLTPMIERAKKAIEDVGAENQFTYIFDSSTGVTLYNGGEDIMELVKKKLGIQ